MENKLSIENNVVEDVIRDSFDILGEEVEFGVEEFINEIIDKEDDEGNLDVDNLPKKEKLNYEEFMEQSKFFFNDENVSEEDKELFFKSLQEIFLDSLKRTKKWGI